MANSERAKREGERSILNKVLSELERSDKNENQRSEDKALEDFQWVIGTCGKPSVPFV